MDTVEHKENFETTVVPFMEEYYPSGMVLQQDGCQAQQRVFMMEEIVQMDWAVRSPDMSCIENCWDILSLALYDDGRQFGIVALTYEWEN